MILSKVHAWMHDEDKGRSEHANTFVMFIVLLPLILGVFGMGVEVSRNVYMRTVIQTNLDLAVASGAAITKNDPLHPGFIDINYAEALRQVERIYATNRKPGPRLGCIAVPTPLPDDNLTKCWTNATPRTSNQPRQPGPVTDAKLTYTVKEYSKNVFLPLLDIGARAAHASKLLRQDYTITSTAILKQRSQ